MTPPTSQQRQLLEESFELALLRDPEFPKLFYDILFRDFPETRNLFKRNSLNAQRTMLSRTLMAAIDHIDDSDWLVQNLAPLGRTHALEYGVRPEMYDWMADALTEAIREVCAVDWTEAHEAAWRESFTLIVAAMRSGEP